MIKNLTWHPITVFLKDWEKKTIQPLMWMRLQLVQQKESIWTIDWIPVTETKYKIDESVLDFFAPKKKWVIYIVSLVVAQTVRRDDFYIVSGKIKSQETNKIIGCSWISPNPYL